eukprot:305173-Chlamydomonas_euryale.AAC.4
MRSPPSNAAQIRAVGRRSCSYRVPVAKLRVAGADPAVGADVGARRIWARSARPRARVSGPRLQSPIPGPGGGAGGALFSTSARLQQSARLSGISAPQPCDRAAGKKIRLRGGAAQATLRERTPKEGGRGVGREQQWRALDRGCRAAGA